MQDGDKIRKSLQFREQMHLESNDTVVKNSSLYKKNMKMLDPYRVEK